MEYTAQAEAPADHSRGAAGLISANTVKNIVAHLTNEFFNKIGQESTLKKNVSGPFSAPSTSSVTSQLRTTSTTHVLNVLQIRDIEYL